MRNKKDIRKDYLSHGKAYMSLKEYMGYQDCVSKIKLGDQVKLYLVENNSFYSYKKTLEVSDWLEVIGKGDRMILVGSKNRFADLYPARDVYVRNDMKFIPNFAEYFCWFVTTSPGIEGRIAELRRA